MLARTLVHTKAGIPASARRNLFHVQVSHFPLWWLSIALLHAFCSIYFAASGWAYWRLPTTFLARTLQSYQITMRLRYFPFISACHVVIAAAHLLCLLKMIINSFRRRQLAFVGRVSRTRIKIQRQRSAGTVENQVSRCINRWKHRSTKLTQKIFSRRGLLGVEGRHFELVYIGREIVETLLQSIQAYKMSLLLPRVYLNQMYVSVIIANCWSTPVALHVLANNPPLARLICLLLDVALDFVSTVGVPSTLIYPYFSRYDPSYGDFEYVLWYNDIWLVNMINEFRLVLISSWGELLTRLIFSFSMLACIGNIKTLLRPQYKSRTASMPPVVSHSRSSRRDSDDVVAEHGSVASGTLLSPVVLRASQSARVTRYAFLSHAVFLIWGLLVMVFHIHAATHSESSSCALHVRPWFVAKPSCALMLFNCMQTHAATGNTSELDSELARMTERSLVHIVIRHCAQVEIPARLQTFHNLVGLKIYNSTLARWESDAALTQQHHPKIVFLFLVDVNMTQLPNGLNSDFFPQQLMDIEFAGTNLTTLPDDLDQRWAHGASVVFERSLFTAIPDSLLRLQVAFFSVVKDQITNLPEQVFTNPKATTLWLNGNPIEALPTDLVPSESLRALRLTSSRVLTFPAWMDDEFFGRVYVTAGDTPLCTQVLTSAVDTGGSSTQGGSDWLSVATRAYAAGLLDCDIYTGDDLTYYPRLAEALLDTTHYGMNSPAR